MATFVIVLGCLLQGVSTPVVAATGDPSLSIRGAGPDATAVLPPSLATLENAARERNSLQNRKIGFDPFGSTLRTLVVLAVLLAEFPQSAAFAAGLAWKTVDWTVPPLLIEAQRIPTGPPTRAA